MLALPYSTALDIKGLPYVTYGVVILCLVIYLFQSENNEDLHRHSELFCKSIYDPALESDTLDVLSTNMDECVDIIGINLNKVEYLIPENMESLWSDNYTAYQDHIDEVMSLMQEHYDVFQRDAPESLDAKLMYYPTSLNPFKSITLSLAHGDFWHIFFNIVAFIAFAPALELLIGNTIKYLAILVMISFATSISYSLTTLMGGDALPSLGLSGIVMGMIGLSATAVPLSPLSLRERVGVRGFEKLRP